jgi:Skp family chaperone for outer membrane proteins
MPNLLQTPPTPIEPSVSETLRQEIQNEKRLRQAAETSLNNAHKELEELTAQLFSQANEMVAAERRARAKLEERVAVLEKRDLEKRRRLERLEKAVDRIDRVKGLVA